MQQTLEEFRISKGWDRNRLAQELGTNYMAIYRLETGITGMPSKKIMSKIHAVSHGSVTPYGFYGITTPSKKGKDAGKRTTKRVNDGDKSSPAQI